MKESKLIVDDRAIAELKRELDPKPAPRFGERRVIDGRVVEWDGRNWREPASGRIA